MYLPSLGSLWTKIKMYLLFSFFLSLSYLEFSPKYGHCIKTYNLIHHRLLPHLTERSKLPPRLQAFKTSKCEPHHPHGIGLPFSLWRRCLPSGFHQSPLLSSFYLPCGTCPAPACGAYLRVFTNALFLIAIKKVSADGFPAWFRMFLLFCLMNLINF